MTKYIPLIRTIFFILLTCCGSISSFAEVTTTTSGNNTTITSTDTIGNTVIPDWAPTMKRVGYTTDVHKLTVKFDVVRGSKMQFEWGITNPYYDKVNITIDGVTVTSDTYNFDYTSSIERMFKKPGTHTVVFTFSPYYDWGNSAFVKNFVINHDAGKGPDGMLPFHTTTIKSNGQFGSDVQWYNIYYKGAARYLYHSDGKVMADTEAVVDSAYYWTFTGNEKDGIQIYNMQTGSSLPVTMPKRVNKSEIVMGGEGDSRFLLGDNGDEYVFYVDGDTAACYLPGSGSNLLTLKSTNIYKSYATNTSTKVLFYNAGTPNIVPPTDLTYELYKFDNNQYTPITCDGYLEMLEGDEVYLDCYALPESATDKSLSYSLDTTSIVNATFKGDEKYSSLTLTAQKGGEVKLTLFAKHRPNIKKEIRIKVNSKVRVESVTLDTDTLRMHVGELRKMNVTVLPENAFNKTLKWTSSRANIVSVSSDGTIYGLAPGNITLTVRSTDGSAKSAKVVIYCTERTENEKVEHDKRYLFALHSDSALTAIPLSYIESKTYVGKSLSLKLAGGVNHVLKDVEEVSEECPVVLPRFTSYKFNNKFNDQLFQDAEADASSLSQDTITIPVTGIGKRLTASFQLHDDTLAHVWVGKIKQYSKETRQRFDRPITYTIGHDNWQSIELEKTPEGYTWIKTKPFGSDITVIVDWLTEHSTTEYIVPRIDIKIGDGKSWNSSQWIGMNGKETYMEGSIKIDGGSVFPDMDETNILIKGRGNTSWSSSYMSKNPYHFKFDAKQKPLGMKAGKHWLLLGNKITGSMTTNAIAHRAAAMFGMANPCHIVPVELYINGSYRGSYNLTERIALANNSVALDDDTNAAIIEMDTYTDEPHTSDAYYHLPIKLKDPDDDGYIHKAVTEAFNTLTQAVYFGDNYDKLVDVEKLASFLLTNEFIVNCELKHPKSVFAYNENIYDCESYGTEDPTPWIFGPLWDCDWAFGYQQGTNYFKTAYDLDFYNEMGSSDKYGTTPSYFWKALRNGSKAVDKAMYSRLFHFITMGGLDELVEYCDDYYEFAKPSFTHNRTNATNEKDGNNYQTVTSDAKSWLLKRANSLFSRYNAYDLSDDEDAEQHPTDGIITARAHDNNKKLDNAIYDVQGRRVVGSLKPGLYIKNGKKFIIK